MSDDVKDGWARLTHVATMEDVYEAGLHDEMSDEASEAMQRWEHRRKMFREWFTNNYDREDVTMEEYHEMFPHKPKEVLEKLPMIEVRWLNSERVVDKHNNQGDLLR